MSDPGARDGPARESSRSDGAGRYLYCVVRAPEGVEDGPDGEFSATGIEGERAYLVTAGDLGAVVQPAVEPYDTGDEETATRWLLEHQGVVDDAGEAFGTPLPFRFDTIIRGDDAAVREWLGEEAGTLRGHLDALGGHWEYRIEVYREDDDIEERLIEEDEELAELRERREAASEGEAFLVEKQYEQRLERLERARRERREEDLRERLAEHAREVRPIDGSPGQGRDDADVRLAVLAREADEEPLGDVLDDVAAQPGVTVRFTGPWPPYTFTPTFDDGAE